MKVFSKNIFYFFRVSYPALARLLVFAVLLFGPQTLTAQAKPIPPNDTEVQDLIPDDLDEDLTSDPSQPKQPAPGSQKSTGSRQGLIQLNDQAGRAYTIDIMAAADFLGQWDNDEPHSTGNRMDAREIELGFMGDVDHLMEGNISTAAHLENGAQVFELHEAWLYFPNLFIPNLTAKIGHMFLDAGRLNSIHRHDWLFSNAPYVTTQIIGKQPVHDSGLELDWLVPWNADRFVQNLVVGVYNGRNFGEAENDGVTKNNPLYTAHLKQFLGLSPLWSTQFGFSYLRYQPDKRPNKVEHRSGLDWLLKWKQDNQKSFQFLTEIWYKETREKRERPYDAPAAPVETRVGTYTFVQYQFSQEWSAGYRYDFFTNPNYRNSQGIRQKSNGFEGHLLQATWRPSEFSYFRASVQQGTVIETAKKTWQFYLQGVFILGKHPAHKY